MAENREWLTIKTKLLKTKHRKWQSIQNGRAIDNQWLNQSNDSVHINHAKKAENSPVSVNNC
jgi:hypothetical protein